MHKVNLPHWSVLAIPHRDTTKPIPFFSMDKDEYATIIKTHKQYVTQDSVEISLDYVTGDLKHRLNVIEHLFKEETKLARTFYEELF